MICRDMCRGRCTQSDSFMGGGQNRYGANGLGEDGHVKFGEQTDSGEY